MSQVLDDKQPRKDKAKPKYEPIDFYQKNTYVDCKDSVNAWCVARILERCDDDFTLKINFDGWSHKWDEWVRFSSTRLAPFRKYSVGYTGQTKFAIRDWKFSLAELKQRTEKLKEAIDSNFTVLKSPFQITQYLRGSEFMYVDLLMEHEYLHPKEELPYVFKHFEVCFELYLTFLKMIPEYLPDYFEGISNLDSFLTNERIALILSFHEVSEIVNSIFAMPDRLWSEFRAYDTEAYGALITTPEEHAGKDINTTWTADEKEDDNDYGTRKSRKYSKIICKLINKFASIGCLDEWMKVFTYHRQDEENSHNPNHLSFLPFRMMEVLLKTLSHIYGYLNKDISENMIVTIKEIILKRLEFIPDRELKELDRDDITKFISKVQSLLVQYYSRDEVISLTETAELDLDLKFLTCSFFEKRLKGIIRIKELAEKIDLYEQDPKIASQSSSPKLLKHLDSKTFIAWIFKNGIFELILGDSIHTEIIKRTHEILKFIAKYETIPNSLLELIWNACEGKHEATVMGLYDIIVDISGHLGPEGVSFLKTKIEAIPDDQQNEMTLNLIKGFAENTLPRLSDTETAQGNTINIDESRFNCVTTMWHLMLDESKVNIGMSEAALKNMVSILREPACQALKRVYLFRCFEQVRKKDSVSQCINLIHSILNNQYYTRGYDSTNSLGAILEQLDEKFGLMELLVGEFEHFYTTVGELVRKNYSGDIPEELKDRSLLGKYSYSVNYHNRLIFLTYLVTNQAYELVLTVEQIERLWNLVILNPIWESDREYFFQWLNFRYEGQTYIRPVCVIKKNLMGEFFERILCNHRKLDFVNLSPKGFETFVSHFKALNEQKANFRVDRALKFLVDDLDYEGKETLWTMFLHCRNEKTTKSIINLLVECHLQLGSGLEKKRKQQWEEFTYKCVNLLKEGHDKQDDKLITKAVIILMHFFDKFEGKNRLELVKDDSSKNSYNLRINTILKPEQNMKSVLVNSQQTIGYLKGLIADRFGLLVDEIEISVRGVNIENDEDSNLIINYPVTEPFLVQRAQFTRTQDGGYHPKQLLAENVECIDLLFQLLSEDLQAVNTIWDLLVRLPVSERTKQSIYDMSNPWETLLGGQSMQQYKLLYCLQIIEDFLFDQTIEKPKSVYKAQDSIPNQFKDPVWAQRFYESGGLKTLLDVLSKPETVDIKSTISLKCLTLILKIVCAFFAKYNFDMIYGENARKKESEITQRVIEAIHNTAEYSLSREHKEHKPDQPFVKTFSKTGDEILRIPEDLFFESKVIFNAQSFFLSLVHHNTTLLTHIYEYPSLQRMLSIGLIDTNNAYLKEKLSQGLLNLMTQFPKADAPLLPHHIFVPVLLQDTLQKALENEDRSEVFFRMLTSLINHINIGEVSLDADDLLSQLVDFLKLRKPMEKTQRDFDIVLHGVLLVLKGLFARYPDKAQKYGQEEELVIELLQNCLFEIPRRVDRKQIPGPKCKNIHTRSAAYKLLIELSRDSDFNLQEIIEYIKPIHQYGKWRTKRYLDWNIVQKDNEKSSTGYVGLKNLGCICYMNSTIQQIYMIPTFRNAILEVEDKQLAITPKEDNILYQLKCIFGALNESEKQYFNPKNFCQSFKDWDGNPTNVYEQMDADEFFLMFMDRLENLIKGTKQENFIKQHFGGVLSNELICKGCPHYSEREEPFLAVSLQVKNKKNIYQSLAAFVEGEMLEGENAYHCAQCDKKVNTLKRVCLKKLPNHLILVLKRFEFDFDTMAKVKVNDYCEFPTKLDLEPYTQQGLRKAEKAKHAENKEGDQDNDAEIQDEYPKAYFEYKLTGIVIHVGFADSGHYISLAQDREAGESPDEQRWYEFNDTEVRFFDPKDIPGEAYGGEEKWRHYTSNQNMTSYREKIKNAYLLFYERITHFDDPQQNAQPDPNAVVQKKEEEFKEDQEERLSFSTAATDRPPSHLKMIRSDRAPGIFRRLEIEPKISDDSKKHYPQDFLQGLLEKNQIFLIHKHVFSKEYFDFIQELVMQRQYLPRLHYNPNETLSPADNAKEYYDLELIKFGTLFLLTGVFRDRMRTNIIKFLPFIKEKLSQNIAASVWLLEVFSAKKIQLEFFLDCPTADMRRFALGVISTAFKTAYNYKLKEGGEPFISGKGFRLDKTLSSVLTNFVNCSINLIFESKTAGRDYSEFFKLFYEIATSGYQAVGYLISKKIIGRFMDFFYEEVSPLNDFFRDMSDAPYWEPEQYDIGEPQEEKTKVRTAWEEYMFKKKDKQTTESTFAHKSYLWKTLCYLLLHCKMSSASQRCEWQIGDYDYQLIQKEKTLLTPDSKFVIKVIDDAASKISYRSVSKFYSYLCYEDEDFTATFLEAIKTCLNVSDTTALRPSFRSFTTLLTLRDSLTDFRVKELCEYLTTLMNNSSLYYLEIDAYTTFLLKITSQLDNVKDWVLSHKDTWNWVITWLTKHPVPPIGLTNDHIKLQKRRNTAGAPNMHNRIHEYKARASIKIRKFQKMMQDEIEDPKTKWDADEDLSEHKFVAGEKVDFDPQRTGRWVTAEVEHVLEEMIKLTYYINEKDLDFQWVSKDIATLAPPNTMTAIQAQVEAESQKFLEVQNSQNNAEQNVHDQDTDNEEGYQKITDGGPDSGPL